MKSSASVFFVLLCLLFVSSQTSAVTDEEQSEDDRQLLMVLQNVLEKLQSRKSSTLDRRQSRLPTCDVRASCSVKKGRRFGQLCDCQPGSRCNFFFLRCL